MIAWPRLTRASTLLERFEFYAMPEPNTGCWLWAGAVDSDGYGAICVGPDVKKERGYATKIRKAHRISYELFRGPIPDGLGVLHRCDMPCCVNPDHFFLGTNTDNVRDMIAKGRQNLTGLNLEFGGTLARTLYCKQDHPLYGENLYVNPNTGRRQCWACMRVSAKKYEAKRKARGPRI